MVPRKPLVLEVFGFVSHMSLVASDARISIIGTIFLGVCCKSFLQLKS